jgi:hypothetical protein
MMAKKADVKTKKQYEAVVKKIQDKGLLMDGEILEKGYFSMAIYKTQEEINSLYCCITYMDDEKPFSVEFYSAGKCEECGAFKTPATALNKITKKLGA